MCCRCGKSSVLIPCAGAELSSPSSAHWGRNLQPQLSVADHRTRAPDSSRNQAWQFSNRIFHTVNPIFSHNKERLFCCKLGVLGGEIENITSVGLEFKVSIAQREKGESNKRFLIIRNCFLEIIEEWNGLGWKAL